MQSCELPSHVISNKEPIGSCKDYSGPAQLVERLVCDRKVGISNPTQLL